MNVAEKKMPSNRFISSESGVIVSARGMIGIAMTLADR